MDASGQMDTSGGGGRRRRASVTFADCAEGSLLHEGTGIKHSPTQVRSSTTRQSPTLASRAQLLMQQVRLPPRGYHNKEFFEPCNHIPSRRSEGGQVAFVHAASSPNSVRPRTQSSPGEMSLSEDSAQPCRLLPKASGGF
ncbi:hypothetical protein DUNSADRAFT_1161 [Dunaliella salina]|uniref:Encoded protein n=1 Tax=Dunaliella salina TaxID=3046 RepID=A0ABQ7GXF7_DUNSA|nr:hypothetical protein DUNSADRAFT_1161 [Dunaliella salina]|eukprot:KAF5839288.1 hypothetical protein DUNSADRAFT_1161 [Dunaliella salina]